MWVLVWCPVSPSILPRLASLSFLSLPSSHFQRTVGVKRSVGFVFFFFIIILFPPLLACGSFFFFFFFPYTRRTKAQREAWAAVSQRQWEEGVITTLQALIRSHVMLPGPRSASSAHSSQLAAAEGLFFFQGASFNAIFCFISLSSFLPNILCIEASSPSLSPSTCAHPRLPRWR